MPTLEIEVKNKIARSPTEHIVCGNSDYRINFAFDAEWAAYNVKTARFIYNGQYEDVVFEGAVCDVPVIRDTRFLYVGVYAGDLHTTTPALVACEKCILCDDGLPADPPPDVYAQIIELLNNSGATGNGLPIVSESDNGKIMQVVGGKWKATELPVYDGAFEITPSVTDDQTLLTAQTFLDANIKISKVPYSEVSNNSGGTTANIGG